MKPSNLKKWLKLIEFVVVNFVIWLDPNATFYLFLIKLCFHILKVMQDTQDEDEKNKKNQDKSRNFKEQP